MFRGKKESDSLNVVSLIEKTHPQIGTSGKGLRVVEHSVRKTARCCQGNCLEGSCSWYKQQTRLNSPTYLIPLISNSDQWEAEKCSLLISQ